MFIAQRVQVHTSSLGGKDFQLMILEFTSYVSGLTKGFLGNVPRAMYSGLFIPLHTLQKETMKIISQHTEPQLQPREFPTDAKQVISVA